MTAIPKRIVQCVLNRDGHRCVINAPGCQIVATDADHRVGRGMGGNAVLNVPEALVACCRPCNSAKEDDADVAADCERRGIKIRRSQSTRKDLARCREKVVVYPSGRRFRLTAEGTREAVA